VRPTTNSYILSLILYIYHVHRYIVSFGRITKHQTTLLGSGFNLQRSAPARPSTGFDIALQFLKTRRPAAIKTHTYTFNNRCQSVIRM